MQREIQQAAYEYQKAIESEDAVVVGVNRYQSEESAHLPLLRIDPEIERSQLERLRKLRARRDSAGVAAVLQEVEATARSERNLMPTILEATD